MDELLYQQIAHQLETQRERIALAARAAGRNPTEIKLIAVSKKQSTTKIQAAYRAGQRDFGENYVQELLKKAEALAHLPGLRWHLIGHLQSNKAKYVAPFVHMVHTVSTKKLVQELSAQVDRRRREASVDASTAEPRPPSAGPLATLVEVNVSGEESKSGCSPDELSPLLDAIDSHPRLELLGLMTVPPNTEDPAGARPHFERLLKLRDLHGGVSRLPELSMGMSRDAEVAVASGSTMVRLGTAIFGAREG